MKSAIVLSILLLSGCSTEDDISITAHRQRCISGNPKTMNIKVSEHGGLNYISIYGDYQLKNLEQGCRIAVDQKTEKVVEILLYQ
jgi:hypothetical protein